MDDPSLTCCDFACYESDGCSCPGCEADGLGWYSPDNEARIESERYERDARNRFIKLRLSTLAWGFAVSLLFTGELVTSVAMWTVVVAGNTLLMYRYAK